MPQEKDAEQDEAGMAFIYMGHYEAFRAAVALNSLSEEEEWN